MESVKIILPFPISVNAAYANIPHVGRVKTKRYRDWLKKCPTLTDKMIGPCTISYKIYQPDKRERDGYNLLKIVTDYLVSEGVIEDDNMNILKGEQWLDYGVDKIHPRIDITIKEYKNEIAI